MCVCVCTYLGLGALPMLLELAQGDYEPVVLPVMWALSNLLLSVDNQNLFEGSLTSSLTSLTPPSFLSPLLSSSHHFHLLYLQTSVASTYWCRSCHRPITRSSHGLDGRSLTSHNSQTSSADRSERGMARWHCCCRRCVCVHMCLSVCVCMCTFECACVFKCV